MTGATLGSVIYTAFKPIIKIYLIIGTGYILARMNILTIDTGRNLSNMVMTALLPCLIFNKIISSIQSSDIKAIGIIGLNATLLFMVGGTCGFIIGKMTPSPKRWTGGIISVGIFPNISDLPIAYVQSMDTGTIFTQQQGNKGVAYVCVYLAFYIIYQFNLGGYKFIEYDFRDALKADIENDTIEEKGTSRPDQDNIRREKEESGHGSTESSSSVASFIQEGQEDLANTGTNTNTELLQHAAFLNARSNSTTSDTSHSSSQAAPLRRKMTTRASTSSNHSGVSALSLQLDGPDAAPSTPNIIEGYSELERLRTNPNLTRTVTGMQDISLVPPDRVRALFQKYHLLFVYGIFENLKKPTSVTLIVSIAFAMIPWVKALFVSSNQVHLPDAPDGNPPLSFMMDFTSYVGAACVPIGLLLVGATLSRLTVKAIPPGFLYTAAVITVFRLVAMPVLGCLVNWGFDRANFFVDDDMLRFISIINWGLPSATTLVYFTAFYSDPKSDDNIQMDCLSIVMLCQYPLLSITLPTLVSYTLKAIMHY
ncbi:hypothetical protein BABINDRAFT_57018 [Babjeviella inositovora NRRL Y-12698]|uniref:Auxin efflux carrier n=1 Tax=Babjeviella inositovora NRRL Y-12698 TaxID=984486 RepID=A0A1E3QZ27_9ASCO|nr:uncharacterized protein BABINDRAFT_57018 [Babjeviella inositovora NRRL Y-12698]ODQ82923.1 hypothetical protein BABINDRAFT_57018 [Babjeviella inositovora NRRL Y-12698]